VTRRRAIVVASAAAALLAGAAAVVLRAAPEQSDEDRIRALFSEAARAAEERRAGDAVRPLSERFRGEGLDRDGVRRLVALETLRGVWTSVAIAATSVAVEGDRARAAVDLVLARGGPGRALADLVPAQASAWRVTCDLERETDAWRIVRGRWRPIPLAEAMAGPPPLEADAR
jgi:hypothetical protein